MNKPLPHEKEPCKAHLHLQREPFFTPRKQPVSLPSPGGMVGEIYKTLSGDPGVWYLLAEGSSAAVSNLRVRLLKSYPQMHVSVESKKIYGRLPH